MCRSEAEFFVFIVADVNQGYLLAVLIPIAICDAGLSKETPATISSKAITIIIRTALKLKPPATNAMPPEVLRAMTDNTP